MESTAFLLTTFKKKYAIVQELDHFCRDSLSFLNTRVSMFLTHGKHNSHKSVSFPNNLLYSLLAQYPQTCYPTSEGRDAGSGNRERRNLCNEFFDRNLRYRVPLIISSFLIDLVWEAE